MFTLLSGKYLNSMTEGGFWLCGLGNRWTDLVQNWHYCLYQPRHLYAECGGCQNEGEYWVLLRFQTDPQLTQRWVAQKLSVLKSVFGGKFFLDVILLRGQHFYSQSAFYGPSLARR